MGLNFYAACNECFMSHFEDRKSLKSKKREKRCKSKKYIGGEEIPNTTVECELEKGHKGLHKGKYLQENWEGLSVAKRTLEWGKNV